MMQLGADWKAVLTKAWSVRLFALSIALQAADVVLTTRGAFSDDPDARIALPTREDVQFPINEQLIVELYSK